MQDDKSTKPDPGQVNRIALKLPQFWRSNIQLWFAQVEAAFILSGITVDETKYASLVASIDADTLTHVSDIIFRPPTERKYETLKERLISEFAESENRRVRRLLSELQLGDSKPSFLLRQMRELAGGKLTDEFLKNLWMQRLSTSTQSILSASTEGLSQLAVLADKIHEISLENTAVYTATSPDSPIVAEVTQTDIADLRQKIDQLTRQIEKLSRERPHNRGSARTRSNTPHRQGRDHSRVEHNNDSKYCFYHERFGANARKCREPCKFGQQGNE